MARFRLLAVCCGCMMLLLAGCASDKGRVLSTAVIVEPANPGVVATLTAAAGAPTSARRSPATPVPLADGWTWYTDAEHDFAAAIPAGWTSQVQAPESGSSAAGVAFVPSPTAAERHVGRILVMSVSTPAGTGTGPMASDELKQQAEAWIAAQGLRAVEPSQAAEVAGWPAVQMVLEANSEDQAQALRSHAAFTDFAKISSKGLATGTHLAILGHAVTKQPWVMVRTTGEITGWVSANPSFLKYDVELGKMPLAFYRPPSGIVDQPGALTGPGRMVVENSAHDDSVLVLAKGQVTFVAVYVRAGDSFTVDRIPNGDYVVYYALGTDWDGSAFHRNVERIRADKDVTFETKGLSASVWTFTIHAEYGNTSGSPVDSAAFPAVVSDIRGE